ncbi:MAG: cytochrome P460 family protein [Pseudomonadales bacterium]|nr:cytochrome P460 family protein [Pseudomonadales bacterium]
MSKLTSVCLAISIFILSGLNNTYADNAELDFSEFVDGKGVISLPKDFRKTMAHLGSWFVPTGEASGFHDVYARQVDVNHYLESGKFQDGAIIIKELRASSSADYTTGTNVSFSNATIKQWFVMIKDSNNRFPDNKSWGDGWGWALFKTDNHTVNVSMDYKKDCLGCHYPAKNNDWVYIEGYPTLAKP